VSSVPFAGVRYPRDLELETEFPKSEHTHKATKKAREQQLAFILATNT